MLLLTTTTATAAVVVNLREGGRARANGRSPEEPQGDTATGKQQTSRLPPFHQLITTFPFSIIR